MGGLFGGKKSEKPLGEERRGKGSEGDHIRNNIGIHTYAVILKFFVERTYFIKSLMSTKKQLNIIVNNKQRN